LVDIGNFYIDVNVSASSYSVGTARIMKNQVKDDFPKGNWFENSAIEVAHEKLKPFINVWLPLIGIHLQRSPKV